MCFLLHHDEKDFLLFCIVSCLRCLETAAPCRFVLLHGLIRNARGQLRSVLVYVQDIVGINFTVSSHLVVVAPVRCPAKIQRHTCVHEHGFCTHALLADKEMDGRRCSWKPWEVPRPVFTRERSPVTDRLIPGRWDHRVLLRAVEAPGAQASSTTSSTSSHSFNLAGSPNTGNVQDCQVCVRGHILPDSSDELCSGPSALFTLAVLLQRF